MISFPAGSALANAGVSPWKNYYGSSSSFGCYSSHHGPSLSVEHKSFDKTKKIIQWLYPSVTNIKIKGSQVECFIESENVPKGLHFKVRRSNVYEITEICFGQLPLI